MLFRVAITMLGLLAAACSSTETARVETGAAPTSGVASPTTSFDLPAELAPVFDQDTFVGIAGGCTDAPDNDPDCNGWRGLWTVHPDELPLDPTSTEVRVLVAYAMSRCGAWAEGRVGGAIVNYGIDDITIDVRLADRSKNGGGDCIGFPAHEVTIPFTEPIGDREVRTTPLDENDWQEPADRDVRDVRGRSAPEAASDLLLNSLRPLVIWAEAPPGVAPGTVLNTEPQPGARLPPGSVVRVFVAE